MTFPSLRHIPRDDAHGTPERSFGQMILDAIQNAKPKRGSDCYWRDETGEHSCTTPPLPDSTRCAEHPEAK